MGQNSDSKGAYKKKKACKRDEGHRSSPQRPQYPNLYRCLKRRPRLKYKVPLYVSPVPDHSLRASLYKVSGQTGKKATHKCSRVEGSISGPEKVPGPVPKPNSIGCYGQLNSRSQHKQGGTHSAEMCALLWNIMTWCHHYQIAPKARHFPGCLNVMADHLCRSNQVQSRLVTASAGVQTDLSKVVHSSCGSICHSSKVQSSIICISNPRPTCLGHRCSE